MSPTTKLTPDQAQLRASFLQMLDLALHSARCAGVPRAQPDPEQQIMDNMVESDRAAVVKLFDSALNH